MRPVPLGLEQPLVSKKAAATNDEVASILKGLQLDRGFFLGRLDVSATKDLKAIEEAQEEANSPGERRMGRMKTKVLKQKVARVQNKKEKDFDIYLGEALMPVLAQALDSLCRQVNRMQMQGDGLDPKVRARFNPLTWLAQQLLRRHPKCAKTPRRQAIYSSFRDWSDLERGRREMLRRRDLIQDVFEGFKLRGVVQRADLPAVLDAIDDTLRLDGVLKGNKEMLSGLLITGNDPVSPVMAATLSAQRREKEDFFKDGGWTWVQFWERFTAVIESSDVAPFSVIQRGIQLQQQQVQLRSEAEDARKKELEERKQMEANQRRQSEEYVRLYSEMQENPHIIAILSESKVLTGDDVRPGDAGYEYEVPPNGGHVTMLSKLLVLLGFEWLGEAKAKPRTPSPGNLAPETGQPSLSAVESSMYLSESPNDRWWDDALAAAWTTMQEIHQVEICDGVVEQDVLEKVLVPPVGYALLRSRIMEELENREDQDGQGLGRDRHVSEYDKSPSKQSSKAKPSIDTLCQRLGITMSRIVWMHKLFESYLQPDADQPDKVPVCLYPECPAAITKVQMKSLMKEIRPSMEEVEFEMRFRRIDQDLSGNVEFDEFVTWVREDEVRVAGAEPMQKLTLEELAQVYGEGLPLIQYLYDQFQDRLPDDEGDNYPLHPRSLAKADVRALVSSLTPDLSDADFETQFQMTTFGKKECLEFDEFLEVLPVEDLPADIKDGGSSPPPTPGPASPAC